MLQTVLRLDAGRILIQGPSKKALQIIAVDNELARDIIVDFVHRAAYR
jgi:hypothetical protein